MAETLKQRVERLEEAVDVLILVTFGHLVTARDPDRARAATPVVRAYVEDPTPETRLAALKALDDIAESWATD